MKKLTAIILTLVMVLSLTACSESEPENVSNNEPAVPSELPETPPKPPEIITTPITTTTMPPMEDLDYCRICENSDFPNCFYIIEFAEDSVHLRLDENDEIIAIGYNYNMGHENSLQSSLRYWFFFDEEAQEYKEYGGVEITLEQFQTFQNHENFLEIFNNYTIESILYRANGVINVHITGDELNGWRWNENVTLRYEGSAILLTGKYVTEPGFYLPANVPEIAIFPDIAEIFN
jgi:uncharacterized lipoprotein YehR (DUF1307 family)